MKNVGVRKVRAELHFWRLVWVLLGEHKDDVEDHAREWAVGWPKVTVPPEQIVLLRQSVDGRQR